MKRRSEQGVALVITLILLSVITFMAVAFLALTRRDREGVINRSHQNDSTFAANAALEHVKAKMVSEMIIHTNGFNFGMLVSTNWINTNGFFESGLAFASLTNVNYEYIAGTFSTNRSLNDQLQNIANLQILPRPPVYVSTDGTKRYNEFRFYLDYNRNGKFDTNGWIEPYFGLTPTPGTRPLMFAKGDPEWIGILDRPELPHSRSNQFIARYAFIALPIGQTMDINYIHNVANFAVNGGTPDQGFRRDQGAGTWEINLGAFLYNFNTNIWGSLGYGYDPLPPALQPTGVGFQDAANIVFYRYKNNWNNMFTFNQMYPGAGPNTQFQSDAADGYSLGLLATNPVNLTPQDPDFGLTTKRWSGSDNTNWFFTPQDFFKVGADLTPPASLNTFSNRLYTMGLPGPTSDTTNQYAFYKLLEQLGVDSFPESGKINVNYANLNGRYATNFENWDKVPWGKVEFFTNAANALLSTLTNTPAPANYPGYTNLTATHIPIYPTNYYTPAVHRMLQLAANIYDATVNPQFQANSPLSPPTVFKPLFELNGNEIYIKGYTNVEAGLQAVSLYNTQPLDLGKSDELALIKSQISSPALNIYGIPYIIGAKKGFPNFNEFSMGSIVQLTRRMQVQKPSLTDTTPANWKYRTQYTVGVSNMLAVEMWNSYSNAYSSPFPRNVNLLVTDDLTMVLTNELGILATNNFKISQTISNPIAPNTWTGPGATLNGSSAQDTRLLAASFRIPLITNVTFVPPSLLRYGGAQHLVPAAGSSTPFEDATGTNAVHWGISITNRLRVMMVDATTFRLLDYVQLDGMDDYRDIMRDLQTANDPVGGAGVTGQLWNSSLQGRNPVLTLGMYQQMQVSLGLTQISPSQWARYMINAPSGTAQNVEIGGFQNFYGPNATNLVKQVPFSPTAQLVNYKTWQANDPLVHYTISDLNDISLNNDAKPINYPLTTAITFTNVLPNIAQLNVRFSPWLGNPVKESQNNGIVTDVRFKDSLVARSDDWQFPTNKFPSVGWLGRVHRGTPWQTVYLKPAPIINGDTNTWKKWTGNNNGYDAGMMHPTNDWKFIGLFTAAVNDNATRGQLSINQTNSPVWYAMLSGAIALTNDSTATPPTYKPLVIDPVVNNLAISNIITGINNWRSNNYLGNVFTNLGDILSVPELTVNSPFLNTNNPVSDAAYEALPQQLLGLLKVGEPRYVVYAYGQSLKPADRSIYQSSGPYFGLCTNYTVTGESLIRAVIHVENPPIPGQAQLAQPRVVVDQYNVMPPE
jgi:hypothetical protein